MPQMVWRYPYVGYTELDMDVFCVQLGCVGVLISKESRASKQPTGLLGCNIISEVQAALKERHGSDYLNTIQSEVNQCWTEALLAWEIGERESAKPGFARLKGKSPICIPAQSSKVVTCTTRQLFLRPTEVLIQAVQGDYGNLPRNVAQQMDPW